LGRQVRERNIVFVREEKRNCKMHKRKEGRKL